MNKIVVLVAAIVGLLLLIASGIYIVTPAHNLPVFLPGHDVTNKVHYKHAIGAFLLSLAVFAFAWFQSGKKSSVK